MSANIPNEIQIEIMKRLPVKSIIRFRSVSKQWKSVIHSSEFITTHHRSINLHRLLISYRAANSHDKKYVSIIDDDSFHQHIFSHTLPPTLNPASEFMLDSSYGLVCLYGYDIYQKDELIVVWNPSIRKSVGISLPYGSNIYIGFGVCPKTRDPKIVKITRDNWQAEVFALSSRAWRSVSWNLPYESLLFSYSQVVIDGVIYWHAYDTVTMNNRIISYDLTSDKFGEVGLPNSLAGSRIVFNPVVIKFNESLAMLHYREDDAGKRVCDVWKMLNNAAPKTSFTKLFTVTLKLKNRRIIGFRKNGQPIVEKFHRLSKTKLEAYDPCSEYISSLEICGWAFRMTSYTESLFLLNHSDSIILL